KGNSNHKKHKRHKERRDTPCAFCASCGYYSPFQEVGMKRFVSFVISALLVSALNSAAVSAQAVSTSQITGTVKDQTGAVLPGVEVTATQIDTGAKRTVISDETGSYILTSLPIGPYRLEVMLPRFRTYVQTGIILQVNSNPTIPIVLAVGQVSEQIEVAAGAALVE